MERVEGVVPGTVQQSYSALRLTHHPLSIMHATHRIRSIASSCFGGSREQMHHLLTADSLELFVLLSLLLYSSRRGNVLFSLPRTGSRYVLYPFPWLLATGYPLPGRACWLLPVERHWFTAGTRWTQFSQSLYCNIIPGYE